MVVELDSDRAWMMTKTGVSEINGAAIREALRGKGLAYGTS